MGCVSSKLFTEELQSERVIRINTVTNEFVNNHIVSLTSTTYGALNIDTVSEPEPEPETEETETETEQENEPIKENVLDFLKQQPLSDVNEPEIINASELMKGLEDVVDNTGSRSRSRSRSSSPFKLLLLLKSPSKSKIPAGKENIENNSNGVGFYTPKKAVFGFTTDNVGCDSSKFSSPLFDPELVALYEKELSEEEEQIKRIISQTSKPKRSSRKTNSNAILDFFEEKCPPGGEHSVVIYTTTLRGIRRTFEDCNTVRSIIESHEIQTFERDVSMDSGYKDELRKVMGTNEVKVPIVFVKGRLVGGVDQVVKLEEEGKLGVLFDGIPRALGGGCEVCGGMRFVMCMECNGSSKVLDREVNERVKCGECNENGLVHCPLCCLLI